MKDSGNDKELFYSYFNERFGESISEIEMASFESSEKGFELLGLSLPEGAAVLYGLLVFCKSEKVYFYVHPSESMMGAMMRVAKQGDGPKEQVVCLTDVEGFKFLPKEKHWYDFFIGNSKFEIDCEAGKESEKIFFTFSFQKKADEIRKYIN